MKNFYSFRFERDGEVFIKILRADSFLSALEKSEIEPESIISVIKNPLENNKETKAPMNTQENPFPWRLFYGKIIDANGNTVCMLPSRQSNDSANLICAASDMFQALQAIVDAFGDQDSLLIDQCKAAVNKAIGKQ